MKFKVEFSVTETKGGYIIYDSGGAAVATASGRRSLLARVGELAKITVEAQLPADEDDETIDRREERAQ